MFVITTDNAGAIPEVFRRRQIMDVASGQVVAFLPRSLAERRPGDMATESLLTASSELLAACEAMQRVLRAGPTDGKDLSYELGLARAAIEKARGRCAKS